MTWHVENDSVSITVRARIADQSEAQKLVDAIAANIPLLPAGDAPVSDGPQQRMDGT